MTARRHGDFCHNSRCLHCNSDPQLRAEIEAAWARYEERVLERVKRPHDHADFFSNDDPDDSQAAWDEAHGILPGADYDGEFRP